MGYQKQPSCDTSVAAAIIIALTSQIALAGSACSDNEARCTKYADHLAQVMTKGLSGVDSKSRSSTVKASASAACSAGKVESTQIDCVLAATDSAGVLRCTTGAPSNEAPVESPASKATAKTPATGEPEAVAKPIAKDLVKQTLPTSVIPHILAERCDRGDPRACYRLGLAVEFGGLRFKAIRGQHDVFFARSCKPTEDVLIGCLQHKPAPAAETVAKLCAGGRDDACRKFLGGKTVAERISGEPRSTKTFERACENGRFLICRQLPSTFVGKAVPGDKELPKLPKTAGPKAVELAKLCDRNVAAACARLASMYSSPPKAAASKLKPSYERANAIVDRVCNPSVKLGCEVKAAMAMDRTKGKVDADVVRMLKEACDAGDSSACVGLASWLAGSTNKQDRAEGVGLALEACVTLGHKPSCQLASTELAK